MNDPDANMQANGVEGADQYVVQQCLPAAVAACPPHVAARAQGYDQHYDGPYVGSHGCCYEVVTCYNHCFPEQPYPLDDCWPDEDPYEEEEYPEGEEEGEEEEPEEPEGEEEEGEEEGEEEEGEEEEGEEEEGEEEPT